MMMMIKVILTTETVIVIGNYASAVAIILNLATKLMDCLRSLAVM